METKENITGNYHQLQVSGNEQTILIDHRITGETDELDFTFNRQSTPIDPEDEQDDEEDDDDDFPAKEDLEEEDFDLNIDEDEDFELDIDNK